MADEVDVETALVSLITTALYPNGTGQACAAGVPCKVFRGWPTPQAQELAKANNFVNVSVSCRNGVERNTSRYTPLATTLTGPVHTLTATVTNNTITIGGTVSTPQNVVVLVGQQFQTSYGVAANDTLNSVASGVAALINTSFPGTTANGAVVTVPTGQPLIARIASSGSVITEVKRQDKSFQITVWAPPCNNPASDADAWRTAVASIIDPQLALPTRITLADQTYGWIHYERTITMDTAEAEGLYRRDLFYWVEYGTTITTTAFEIGTTQVQISGVVGTTDGTLNSFPSNVPVENANT